MAKKLLLSVATLLVALVAAELGHRAWLAARGRPYDAEATDRTIRRFLAPDMSLLAPRGALGGRPDESAERRSLALHPYTGAEGFSDPYGVLAYFRAEPPDTDYTIVVVGGSVAQEMMMTCGEALAAGIGCDPRFAGRTVRALNYAHWGYKAPQQLARVLYLFELGLRPDAVVNLDGYNETVLAAENSGVGFYPAYPTFGLWAQLVRDVDTDEEAERAVLVALWRERTRAQPFLLATVRHGLERSSLWGTFALDRLRSASLRCSDLRDELVLSTGALNLSRRSYRQLAGPPFDKDDEGNLPLAATIWFESSISLAAACRARGTRYVHVLQPTLHDRSGKTLTTRELARVPPGSHIGRTIAAGYALLREKAHGFAAQDVDFVDAGRAFAAVESDLYYDECHVVEEGSRILATAIARGFLATLDATQAASDDARPDPRRALPR